MTAKTLENLLNEHAGRNTDKAGFSELDIWMSDQIQNRKSDAARISEQLVQILETLPISKEGYWSSISYLIKGLKLKSASLSNALEAELDKFESLQDASAHDLFSACLAFHNSGGLFSPKILNEVAGRLRTESPHHWLSLAMIAYKGNDKFLIEVVGRLVKDKLIRAVDIETRYRSFEQALHSTSLTEFLTSMIRESENDQFSSHLSNWARKRHGIVLPLSNSASKKPTVDRHLQEPAVIEKEKDQILVMVNIIPSHKFDSTIPLELHG